MKRLTWLLGVVAAAILLAAPLRAAEEGAEPAKADRKVKPASDALRGEYAMMVNQCQLTAEQQDQLKEKVRARKEAMKAWSDANGAKTEALREAQKKARETKDKEAGTRAREALRGLEADRAKIDADSMAAILAILTPDQRTTWDSFRTYRFLMGRYKRVDLTDEQKAKVREVAAAAAKEMGAVAGDDKASHQAQRDLRAKLQKTVEETVLTAAQREALQKKPDRPPSVEKAPKKAAPTDAGT